MTRFYVGDTVNYVALPKTDGYETADHTVAWTMDGSPSRTGQTTVSHTWGTTMNDININFSSPVSGTYNASPSMSFPAAGTGVIWQVTAYYYSNNNAAS